jgi:hypothetical protein
MEGTKAVRLPRRAAGVLAVEQGFWQPPMLLGLFTCPHCSAPGQTWPVPFDFDPWHTAEEATEIGNCRGATYGPWDHAEINDAEAAHRRVMRPTPKKPAPKKPKNATR